MWTWQDQKILNKLVKLDLRPKCRLPFFCINTYFLSFNHACLFSTDYIILSIILQTAKINQGNIALKRVVESIANGDSHVPFRDSKLTMLLQVELLFFS